MARHWQAFKAATKNANEPKTKAKPVQVKELSLSFRTDYITLLQSAAEFSILIG